MVASTGLSRVGSTRRTELRGSRHSQARITGLAAAGVASRHARHRTKPGSGTPDMPASCIRGWEKVSIGVTEIAAETSKRCAGKRDQREPGSRFSRRSVLKERCGCTAYVALSRLQTAGPTHADRAEGFPALTGCLRRPTLGSAHSPDRAASGRAEALCPKTVHPQMSRPGSR